MSARMRARISGRDGSKNRRSSSASWSSAVPSHARNGRYHSPGFAPSAAIAREKSCIFMPNWADDSSHGPRPESNWPVRRWISGGLISCQPSSITTYGRTARPFAHSEMYAASARKFVAVFFPYAQYQSL